MAGFSRDTQFKAATEPGKYGDQLTPGLFLNIARGGTKSWQFRYQINGKRRTMGLGGYPDVTLVTARGRVTDARALIAKGIDPLDARDAEKAAAAAKERRGVTFAEYAEKFMALQEAGWKSDKHRKQWTATLEKYAYPVIGNLPVAEVETRHVLDILQPIWTTKNETASRVRGRIEKILNAARAEGLRDGQNPATYSGHLQFTLPARSRVATVQHHPMMPVDDVPSFYARLRSSDATARQALALLILTAVRSGEVRGAAWSEIDEEARLWTIPAERMKVPREHVVPLSDAAMALIAGLRRDSALLFPSTVGTPLSDMALTQLMRRMGEGAYTVHGFRSSFRSWVTDTGAGDRDIAEMCLAHAIGNKTEQAYNRGAAMERRRALLSAWAGYVCGIDSITNT